MGGHLNFRAWILDKKIVKARKHAKIGFIISSGLRRQQI